MDSIPRPVISCCGHDGLVSELEQRCLQTIASEPALWRHSKHVAPYPVRIDAYFTRFNLNQLQSTVKVLSSGRPTRPLGSLNPILYVYVVPNNSTQYTTGGVKQKLTSWLGHLQAGNINDWLVLMIDADQNSNKMWQKTSVLDQIKRDFRVSAPGSHFLQLPDRRAVEEKVFLEAWTTFLRSFRKLLLTVYQSTIQDYEDHLQLLREAQGTPGWEFFEYLERKEELAQLYLTVNGFEDALQQYYSLESLLASAIRKAVSENGDTLPGWINNLNPPAPEKEEVCSFLSYFPWVKSRMHPHLLELVKNRSASVFDIRNYLLSREFGLLKACSRVREFPPRALIHIRHGLEESKLLGLSSPSETHHLWAFLCSLNCLNVLRPSSSDAADGVADSVMSVLSNAFRPLVKQASSLIRPTVLEDGLIAAPMNKTPSTENAFLRDMSELNPALASLASTVHFLYKFLLSNAPTSTEKTQTIIASGELPPICSQAVDLWFMVFIELTYLGRVLCLWTADNEVSSPESVIQTIKLSVFQCFASDLTDQSAFGRSVHKQLGVVLTSPSIYEEIYIAVAQILIGFLRLIHEPRKTPYVCCLLADFMRTRHFLSRSIELYSIVLSIYLRDGWAFLTVPVCLLLACCLRTYLEELRTEDVSLVGCLTRYSDCCLLLSCATSAQLQLACQSFEATTPTPADRLELTVNGLSVPPQDLSSADFWWSEAVKCCRELPEDIVFDASCSLSSPFDVEFIRLNGVCNDGYQLITLGLHVTADVHFKISLHIRGTQPDGKDWETIMQYGVVKEKWPIRFDSSPSKGNLQITELQSTSPTNIVKSASGSPTLKRRTAHSRSFAHLFRRDSNALYHSTESVGRIIGNAAPETPEVRRKTSLLDTAASLASRPAWTSQEGLHVVRLSKTASIDGSVESAAHLTVDDPSLNRRGDQPLPHRSASFQNGQYLWPPTSTPGEDGTQSPHSSEGPAEDYSTLESEADACFLRPIEAASDSAFEMSFLPLIKGGDSSLVLLKPGLNEIQLAADRRGFFLPKRLFLAIVERGSAKDLKESFFTSNLRGSFKMCYDLRTPEFSPTWSDSHLLDVLLPKIDVPPALHDKPPTIPVVLGLRQRVPICLQLGKLGFPKCGDSSVTLYRLIPDNQQNSLSSSPPKAKLGPSDYVITPPILQKPESIGQQILAYPYEYQDGPVSVSVTENEATSEARDKQTSIQLSRSLWITPVTNFDEFFLSMPYGYMCRLPVRVIRPLVIMLNIYTIHPSDTVIFAIRIACMDIPETPGQPLKLIPDTPLTFRLSQFQFMVTAPTAQDNVSSPSSRKESMTGMSTFSVPQSLASSRRGSYMQLSAADLQKPELSDCMFATPVDPRCTDVEVNRLGPVNLLFRVKFSEFRPFVKALLKRFGQSPVARFSCSFGFADDSEYEALLTFSRAISPVRQRVPDKTPGPVSNALTRTRKENRMGS